VESGSVTPRKRNRRIGTLRSRADHLERRLAAEPDRPRHHDRAELVALRWAIEELEQQQKGSGQ
jgi:hypothetical protein